MHNYLNNGDVSNQNRRNQSNPMRLTRNDNFASGEAPKVSKSLVARHQTNEQNPGQLIQSFTPEIQATYLQLGAKQYSKKTPLSTSH